jgi:hypothetical protein
MLQQQFNKLCAACIPTCQLQTEAISIYSSLLKQLRETVNVLCSQRCQQLGLVPHWADTGVVCRLYVNLTDPLDGGHFSVQYLESKAISEMHRSLCLHDL